MTYGEQGYEYEAPCILVSHILIQCKTVPDLWAKFIVAGTVSGQTSLFVKKVKLPMLTLRLLMLYLVKLVPWKPGLCSCQGSNLGLADSSRTPVRTSIEIIYRKTPSMKLIWTHPKMQRKFHFPELCIMAFVIAFESPTLECVFCSRSFLRVKLSKQVYTSLKMAKYVLSKDPEIKHIYVTDGKTVASRHVQVSGNNFGQRGVPVLFLMENKFNESAAVHWTRWNVSIVRIICNFIFS